MRHLDLFSGIGGFALAAEMVWPEVEHTFCDNEPFAQAILKKHWPDATIYGDIRTLTADSHWKRYFHGQAEKLAAKRPHKTQREPVASSRPSTVPEIDLLTGGFPCQPFSQAGRRRGTEDNRYLWPEMLRVIREFHPRWVIGENVGGLITWNNGMVLEQVCADLEREGYAVQAFVIPAVALNAPHRRDRVWIVAHASSERCHNGQRDREGRCVPPYEGTASKNKQERKRRKCRIGKIDPITSNNEEFRARWDEERTGQRRQCNRNGGDEGTNWDENWSEVAARLCTVDDGLPRGLARPRGWRNAALKGAGNAIVPQVAAEIMRAIKATDI